MRTFIALICFCGSAYFLNAQGFSFAPDAMVEDYASFEQYNIFQIDINNDTDEALQLSWRRLEADYPEGWEISFCDNNICYGLIPVNGDMIPFNSDEYAFLKLDVNPHQIPGTGTFQFMVFPSDETDNFKVSTFIIHAGTPSNTLDVTTFDIKIGPNPMQDWLNIENPGIQEIDMHILSANGQAVFNGKLPAHSKEQIDLSKLKAGTYFINALIDGIPAFNFPIVKL